ncbi:hypothetical protein Gotri_014793 [Gossypium trilobum]|uniref:Uncharacterized protein n=1 Tax=Gossypium trilobum TaxID=34281 RepID=A0A7J9DY55_9ROSI|nr:hypothetical protein [Gossypium trilobum]
MLSALKGRVAKLEGSIRDVRETLDVVKGRIDELDLMKKKLRDYVIEALSANWDVMKEAPNATKGGQTEKNDALEAMVMALKEKTEAIMEKIKDLEVELALCRVTAGKKMLASVPKQLIIDVPKPKEFKEMSSTRDVDNGVVDPHMRNKVRPKLGLGRSFRKSSMSSFTPQYVEKEAQVKLHRFSSIRIVQSYDFGRVLNLSYFEKDMFDSSNPKGNGNGREDEERQVENGNNNSNNEKPQKWEKEAQH